MLQKLCRYAQQLLLCLALIASHATSVYALPTSEVLRYYYSDETFSDEVGYKYLLCDGYRESGGQITGFVLILSMPCSNPPPGYDSACWIEGSGFVSCPTVICQWHPEAIDQCT